MTIDRPVLKTGGDRQRRNKQTRPEWASGLRRLYDTVLEEPLPDSFNRLLDALDSADGR